MILFIMLLLVGQSEIATLQKEIRILNLVNGLELSKYQMEYILEKAREVEEIRNNFREQIGDNENSVLQILGQLKESQTEDEIIPDELRRGVYNVEARLSEYKMEMFESIEEISKQVEDILDGSQIYQLEHYIACLIPPPGETKIGQAENPVGLIKQLTRIRQMPDRIYEIKKYEIADKAAEKIKKHLPPGATFDEDAERIRTLKLFNEIRNTTDIDFVLKKEDYIEKFKGEHHIKRIPASLCSKIERFLLNPLIISIIEEKLGSKQ